ncbi:hypothetical protein C2S52_003412 [Perilla frutescens var. hirtella]|nr:hypothetical protein C2S52_003412 [Perilla frutescens var. hirtella]
MAEYTCFQDLLEAQKKLDQTLQTETLKREATETKIHERMKGMNANMQGKFEYLTKLLAEMRLEMFKKSKGKDPVAGESILGKPLPSAGLESVNYQRQTTARPMAIMDPPNSQIINPLPKVDFPKFDGSLPRSWIIKSRFDDLKETKIICEFNKLKHTGSYEDYVERFEELKACMDLLHPGEFTESYYMASFLSGLRDELKSAIMMFKPSDLQHTIELGQSQILTVEAISRKLKGTNRSHPRSNPNFPRNTPPYQPEKGATTKNLEIPLKTVTPLLIKVANGHRLISEQAIEDVTWEMQGHSFQHSPRILQNEGYDLILGGDGLKACTPIELDYDKMVVTVKYGGKKVKLYAQTSQTES